MQLLRRMAARIVRVYRQASAEVRAQGREWYANARRTAAKVARAMGHTKATACGVIAALSPRLGWTHNVNAAIAMLAGRDPTGVFKASKSKARRIIAGERPLSVLSGPKVRAFYAALMGDQDAAVIDVWMARAAGLKNPQLKEREYNRVAAALKLASSEVGERVAALQAIAWVQTRGRA